MYQSKKELTMATANRKPPGFHSGIIPVKSEQLK